MKEIVLHVDGISKSFLQPDRQRLVILQGLFLQVARGSIVAISGASGSGKSTLLHLVGSLDRPDMGRILFEGQDIFQLSGKKLSLFRNQTLGFVFQFHYLMPELSVLENVAAPYLMRRFCTADALVAAAELLAAVGLAEKHACMPHQLSGGEKQRAAIARSLINGPRLLLADEPTGNLDWKTGEAVFNLFKSLIRERGLTALIATHNPQLAALSDERFLLANGSLQRL